MADPEDRPSVTELVGGLTGHFIWLLFFFLPEQMKIWWSSSLGIAPGSQREGWTRMDYDLGGWAKFILRSGAQCGDGGIFDIMLRASVRLETGTVIRVQEHEGWRGNSLG